MIRAFNAFPTGFTGAIPLPSNLLRLPLFEGLDVAALARITAGASEVNLRSGTVMFRRGDPCKGLFLLVQGKVKLSLHAPNGTEKVVELVGPGGCVGESTIARGRAHALTAETITETRLVYVAAAVAQEELKRTPLFGRRIIASLSERMHCLIAALEDCMLRSGTERVSGYLISQLPSDVERGAGAITLSVKKGIIASQLNLTQEHFSRILRDLARKGLIEVQGRRVRVLDVAQLRAHATSAAAAHGLHPKGRNSTGTKHGLADYGVNRHGDPTVAGLDGSG